MRDESIKHDLIARQAETHLVSEQEKAVTQVTAVATKEAVRRILGIPDNAWAVGLSPRWLIGGEVRAVHVGNTGELHVRFNGFPGLRQEAAVFPAEDACVVTVIMPQKHLTVFPGKHPELERKMSRISRQAILRQEKDAEEAITLIADEAPGSADSSKPPETLHPVGPGQSRNKRRRKRG